MTFGNVSVKMRKEKGQQSFDFLEKVDDEGSDADKGKSAC